MKNDVFHIVNDQLVSTTDNITIPEDEPIFILRGRDSKALSTIRIYQSVFTPMNNNWKKTQKALNDFADFRKRNPQKMTEPSELY